MAVYAYIDGNNLTRGVREMGWELDYARFRVYLRDKYKVRKAYLFLGYIPKYREQYKQLRQAGYILVFKPAVISIRNGVETYKANVDAEIVLHCTSHFYENKFTSAVIVSGDGDFFCLIKRLDRSAKLERQIIPNRYRHSQLFARFPRKVSYLNALKEKLGT